MKTERKIENAKGIKDKAMVRNITIARDVTSVNTMVVDITID